MKRLFRYLSLIFFITSCNIPYYIPESYKHSYKAEIYSFEGILKTNGYYYGEKKDNKNFGGQSIIFFNDGTTTMNIRVTEDKQDVLRGNKLYDNPFGWGTFNIKDGIIISNHVFSYGFGPFFLQSKFKIINDSTLLEIKQNTNDNIKQDTSYLANINKHVYTLSLLKFIPLENKPDSLCWLKEKRWFWCNKEQYKKWKKEQKKKYKNK